MTIFVVDYDPAWPLVFEGLRANAAAAVGDVALSIEHVGSTSVPGLAAKPVIDMDIVVASADDAALAIERLASIGYTHVGDLGIEGREVLQPPEGLPEHHLYVCLAGGVALANHVAVRDYLRSHADVARRYGDLKKRLAGEFPDAMDSYIDGKTDLLLEVLAEMGLSPEQLGAIEDVNRK